MQFATMFLCLFAIAFPHAFLQNVHAFGVFPQTFTQCIVDFFSQLWRRFNASKHHNCTITQPILLNLLLKY